MLPNFATKEIMVVTYISDIIYIFKYIYVIVYFIWLWVIGTILVLVHANL